ncbi:MAG TPA: PilZ domain-containing protein [Nitrospirota bacterium]|nr:PilZ domain-containing protein [Nitrospirota bacterium]
MKKIIIAQDISSILQQKNSFLQRADIKVFTAASNDELLKIHRDERADLIITQLDMPGMATEKFCSLVRGDSELGAVSIIMICTNNSADIELSSRCRANAVILRPISPALILAKAQQLLDITWRETYRVLISLSVDGNTNDTPFFCRSQNISTSGMLIETDKTIPHGDRVICSFFLPESIRIQATGEIVRIPQQATGATLKQYGVKFSNLTHEAKQALEAFVEKKAKKMQSGGS